MPLCLALALASSPVQKGAARAIGSANGNHGPHLATLKDFDSYIPIPSSDYSLYGANVVDRL